MNYSNMTDEERLLCLNVVATLLGEAGKNRQTNEFSGLARVAYLVAWEETVQLLKDEHESIRRGYPEVT